MCYVINVYFILAIWIKTMLTYGQLLTQCTPIISDFIIYFLFYFILYILLYFTLFCSRPVTV